MSGPIIPSLRAVLLGSLVVLAILVAAPLLARPATEVTCQMLSQPGFGWTCPLSVPAPEGGNGELILEFEYAPPVRTPITELWEVTSPGNESWQLPVRGSSSRARGTLALHQNARISGGLWRARPLGVSVTPIGVRLTLSRR